jgi:hypothetical protein
MGNGIIAPPHDSPLQRIRQAFCDYMVFNDSSLWSIDVVVACYVANLFGKFGDPVWLHLVAPASSGKTAIVEPFLNLRDLIVAVSTLTENSLASGKLNDDGTDPSLLLILNGKVLTIKDLTAILNGPPRIAHKIFGDMRDSYDGMYNKASGSIGLREYVCKYGIISCVTDIIDTQADFNQQLGERFLKFRLSRVHWKAFESMEFLRKAWPTTSNKEDWKAGLAERVGNEMCGLVNNFCHLKEPTIDYKYQEEIRAMAYVLSTLRTTSAGPNPVDAERGTRVMQQLKNLGMGRILADGRTAWDDTDTALIRRVVIDTMPLLKRSIAWALDQKYIAGIPIGVNSDDIRAKIKRSNPTVIEEHLGQFAHTEVVTLMKPTDKEDTKMRYALEPEFKATLDLSGLFVPGPHLPNWKPPAEERKKNDGNSEKQ